MRCRKHGENLFLVGVCSRRGGQPQVDLLGLCAGLEGIQRELCEGLIVQLSLFPVRVLSILQYLQNKHQRTSKPCFGFVLLGFFFRKKKMRLFSK